MIFSQQIFIFIFFLFSFQFFSVQSLKSSFFKLKLERTKRALCSQLNSPGPDRVSTVPFTGTGCVLLAQPGEYDHFLIKSAVLIYEHANKGTLGVILDKPSACTMGESSPNVGPFQANTLFLGGSEGSDMAVMIHAHNLGGYAKYLGYGMYVGGMRQAKEKVESFNAHPRDFKFIFNNVQWGPGVLEKEIEQGRWDVCCIPPELILRQEPKDFNALWALARNQLRSAGTLRVLYE
jgi:putative transcriptional regulator